jgi:hypothetical protein
MTIDTAPVLPRRDPELLGQVVVVIGGSSGIGLETARRARSEGAEVILTGRDPGRLVQPARRLSALGTAAFDATDPASVAGFFDSLAAPVDHTMVAVCGLLALDVARAAAGTVKPAGSLVFVGRKPLPDASGALIAALASELAPVRVNVVASGLEAGPSDVASLAVHLMTNAAITGATVDVVGAGAPGRGGSAVSDG